LPNTRDPVIKRATVNRDQCVECYGCFNPVNLGDARNGGALRPSRSMNPFSHWRRDIKPNFRAVIDGFNVPTTAAAVFDNRIAAEDLMKAVREADLGLSVNISTSIDGAEQCCHAAGIPRHSVGYSLGFEGKTEHLPNEDVLKLSTMCGHGMVASSLAKKMIDWVWEGRRTPEQASSYLARLLLRSLQSQPCDPNSGAERPCNWTPESNQFALLPAIHTVSIVRMF
jgi:hypothetical protein